MVVTTVRLRLSLYLRTAAAAAIVGSFSVVVALLLAGLGLLFGGMLLGFVAGTAETLASYPRVSAFTPVPAAVVAVGALLSLVAGVMVGAMVSTGLPDALDDDELAAVLAHGVSHPVNGDSRIMGAALVPVLVADEYVVDDPEDFGDHLWNAAVTVGRLYGQFGVAVLSRGREWAADAGAAALTGSPAALASALERPDEARRRPGTDLREWEQTTAALDVLPPAERGAATGPFSTHPDTTDRVDRLRRLAGRRA